MQTGYNTNSGSDCQIIYAVAGDGTENTTNTSVINNAITTFYTENGTERLRHNFTIFDYCGKGNLMGGGILYATVENGSYRQQTAGTNLATKASRESFINRVLGENYSTEYRMQTIENTGFRYKPYNPKESVFNYSDIYHAYITTFESSNVNSSNYEGQKLRVFSFMVYSNQGAPVIVSSEGYAEVERYIDQSN